VIVADLKSPTHVDQSHEIHTFILLHHRKHRENKNKSSNASISVDVVAVLARAQASSHRRSFNLVAATRRHASKQASLAITVGRQPGTWARRAAAASPLPYTKHGRAELLRNTKRLRALKKLLAQ
jgi:hypothetical protein